VQISRTANEKRKVLPTRASEECQGWDEKCIKEIAERDDVFVVEGPMCGWGMKASGKSYVREMTKWMTNSEELAIAL
jgi:hypothetical protein